MQNLNSISQKFLKSSFSLENTFISTEKALEWIKDQNRKVDVNIEKIPFDELNAWSFENDGLKISHDSGKFFSIEGIRIKTNWGGVKSWDQPIINQPEIGYLGFLTKEINGILHFLVQAKIEPGNVNFVQLSPTLQATKSNYTRAHKGKSPAYLDYFINAKPEEIILDQLQSEQGARFLRKRNRNIILKVEEGIKLLDNFIWLTLAQIKVLMSHDNLVNMDTRTVISGIPFGNYTIDEIELFSFFDSKNQLETVEKKLLNSTLLKDKALHSFDSIISFVTKRKSFYELEVETIPLDQVRNWIIEKDCIRHEENRYFRIIATKVSIENREVVSWTQPMVEPAQEGLCAFVCKEIDGVLHFAVQVKLECGNFDIIEFAPTVQCLTGNYRNSKNGSLPFLDYILNIPKEQIVYDTLQSEEGGRFFKEQNRNMLVFSGEELALDLPENFIWMTANQLQLFIKFNNYVNIQARSLLAALTFKY